jgi:hypothetical protein
MSISAPDPFWKKLRGAILAVLILSVIAVGFLGTALVLGTEPRLTLERSGPGTFRVTGENFFAGYRFFTKTIDGVTEVVAGSAARDRRSDSLRERQRRQSQKHLDLYGADGSRIGWDREDDQRQIEEFMRGTEARLALADPPPLWRMAIAWCCAGFGALIFIGAIQSNFFPKTKTLSGLP